MNPRRFRSNRPGGGRPGHGRPRRGGPTPDAPMLLGEPSPSLAKINKMNMAKLEEKIASLKVEQKSISNRLAELNAKDPPPAEKIKLAGEQLARLEALEAAASDRLAGKQERKAVFDDRSRSG